METLVQFKQYLLELNYPNINILNETQVAELFVIENRIFFLSWALKKLYNILLPEKDKKETEITLSEYMYENGFCTSSEKLKFVQGDMPIENQVSFNHVIYSNLYQLLDF